MASASDRQTSEAAITIPLIYIEKAMSIAPTGSENFGNYFGGEGGRQPKN